MLGIAHTPASPVSDRPCHSGVIEPNVKMGEVQTQKTSVAPLRGHYSNLVTRQLVAELHASVRL